MTVRCDGINHKITAATYLLFDMIRKLKLKQQLSSSIPRFYLHIHLEVAGRVQNIVEKIF